MDTDVEAPLRHNFIAKMLRVLFFVYVDYKDIIARTQRDVTVAKYVLPSTCAAYWITDDSLQKCQPGEDAWNYSCQQVIIWFQ